MLFNDLREFINEVEKMGEYKVIEGADADLEIGLITEWQSSIAGSPLLFFDNIKGYSSGYRIATNLFTTSRRTALALGLPIELSKMQLIKAIKDKLAQGIDLLPPVEANPTSAVAPLKTA